MENNLISKEPIDVCTFQLKNILFLAFVKVFFLVEVKNSRKSKASQTIRGRSLFPIM